MPKIISNIVFTRNRPLQLEGYLESLYRSLPVDLIQTYIIYKVDLFHSEYLQLFQKYPNCLVIRETAFHDDFVALINQLDTKYVLFGTDDVVYYDSMDFDVIDETFNRFSHNIFGFSLRFGPENVEGGHNVRTGIKVARIFNTYGPRMHPNDGRVVSNFIIQSLKNEPVTIYGDGGQTRSFCYVDDQIEAFIRFMDSPADFTGPINLGNPNEISILDLANKIVDLIGSSSKIENKPLPCDDPRQRCPDITLAKKKLGWQPTVPLEEGLKKTIDYFELLLSKAEPYC